MSGDNRPIDEVIWTQSLEKARQYQPSAALHQTATFISEKKTIHYTAEKSQMSSFDFSAEYGCFFWYNMGTVNSNKSLKSQRSGQVTQWIQEHLPRDKMSRK